MIRRAEWKGMKVNTDKTYLLCILDAQTYTPSTYILDADGLRIEGGEGMKVVGFHFSNKPDMTAHVRALVKRFRQRFWTIRHLKRNGFTTEELIRTYMIYLRPMRTIVVQSTTHC